MDLRDQRAFVRGNPESRAQSPGAERAFESLHELVYAFSGSRGNCDVTWESFEVRINHFSVCQIIDLVKHDQNLLAVSVEFFDYSINRFHLFVHTRMT